MSEQAMKVKTVPDEYLKEQTRTDGGILFQGLIWRQRALAAEKELEEFKAAQGAPSRLQEAATAPGQALDC